MTRHAFLCGCAPDGFTQKKINEMHDFLTGEAGGSWAEKEIVIFPNGVSEAMLSFVLERLRADKTEQILLYICTLSPVADDDESVWLGGEEVRKSVIGAFCADGCGQVVYDCGREVESDEEMEDSEFSVLETASQSFRGGRL
ncbi:hypothetical protein [uncultured Treponema sp.]|uniref:hypothetical protein n=1 Tax=uncultured Treponema sp. TaxID=162155 RepID=UPI0025DDC68F|nr:hypothetical protein [uncultured Treponema sp.]